MAKQETYTSKEVFWMVTITTLIITLLVIWITWVISWDCPTDAEKICADEKQYFIKYKDCTNIGKDVWLCNNRAEAKTLTPSQVKET